MASSGPDRSLTGKSYIPQWMKSKINDRYDLEQTMAFSPPNNDDGFFLIKYKRHEEPATQPKPKIVEPKYTPKLQTFDEHPVSMAPTLSKFITTNTTPREVGMRHPGEQTLTKIQSSVSSEDSKEGSPPFGSTSIVAVAHQMISENKGLNTTDSLVPPRLRIRRNSKSLPASPQTSPKIMRKNPFFANIFFGSTELVNSTEESRTMSRTASTEETRVSSWSSRVVRAFSDDTTSAPTRTPQATPGTTLKAKPSELREMNFWSPTSM